LLESNHTEDQREGHQAFVASRCHARQSKRRV
jgi:hypothetical protein